MSGQAVEDILFSKSFDCGIAPSAEQCVVVDSRIAEEARRAFQEQGAYFRREKEVQAMAGCSSTMTADAAAT